MKGRIPTLPGFFDEDVEAARCGVTVPTLRKWRYRGYGPKAVRIGRVWMYPENADTQFMFEQAAAAESARQPRPRGRPRGAVTPRVVAEQAAVDTPARGELKKTESDPPAATFAEGIESKPPQ